FFTFGGEEDEWDRRQGFIRLEFLQDTEAVEFGHHDIAQDQVGPIGAGGINTGTTVFSGDRFVIVETEERGDVPAHLCFVFDNKNLFHSLLEKRGTLTVTVVPLPRWLSTETSPPCNSAQRFTRSRPRPVPGRLPTLLPRWKALNNCFW